MLELLAPHAIGAHIDLKQPGDEAAVLDAIDRYGLRERVILSTAYPRVARAARSLAPDVPRAIGYPRDRVGVARFSWPAAVTRPGAAALRAVDARADPGPARADAAPTSLALHHTLCSPAAIGAAHRRGVPVFAWTVNDPDCPPARRRGGSMRSFRTTPKMALATLTAP